MQQCMHGQESSGNVHTSLQCSAGSNADIHSSCVIKLGPYCMFDSECTVQYRSVSRSVFHVPLLLQQINLHTEAAVIAITLWQDWGTSDEFILYTFLFSLTQPGQPFLFALFIHLACEMSLAIYQKG